MITYEEFKKIDIVLGEILSAEKVPDTDKLLKLSVDLGFVLNETPEVPENSENMQIEKETGTEKTETENLEKKRDIRQIVSGISSYFPDLSVLVGKKCMFVANLEPRMIRGLESAGMILAVSDAQGGFSLLFPEKDMEAGVRAK